MRWPGVPGSTQHPASQGTGGLVSSPVPGSLGRQRALAAHGCGWKCPGLRDLWEAWGVSGSQLGLVSVPAHVCVCGQVVPVALRGTELASCPAPCSAAS